MSVDYAKIARAWVRVAGNVGLNNYQQFADAIAKAGSAELTDYVMLLSDARRDRSFDFAELHRAVSRTIGGDATPSARGAAQTYRRDAQSRGNGVHPAELHLGFAAPSYDLPGAFAASRAVFSDPAYYAFLGNDLSKARQTITAWYPEMGAQMIATVEKALGESYLPLLLDPGIAARFDEFLDWAGAYRGQHPNADPIAVRQAYAEKLGTSRVWRGMMLLDKVAERIDRAGVLTTRAAAGTHTEDIVQLWYAPYFEKELSAKLHPRGAPPSISSTVIDTNKGLSTHVRARLGGRERDKSCLMSVSAKIEGAHAGAWDPWGHLYLPGGHFFLFELEVPTISVIPMTGALAAPREDAYPPNQLFVTSKWDGQGECAIPFRDPTFEQFIIGEAKIAHTSRYDKVPAKWSVRN